MVSILELVSSDKALLERQLAVEVKYTLIL